MTVNKLHKILSQMIAEGAGRCLVSVYKPTFTDPREDDGCVILPVQGCKLKPVMQIDDDGGTKVNARGQECCRNTCVLFGCGANDEGDIPQ